jgi:aspartate kinase
MKKVSSMSSRQLNVFKFGGASVQKASSVRNVARIIKSHTQNPLLIVISAIGKTTNALEKVLEAHAHGIDFQPLLNKIRDDHFTIMRDLFPEKHFLFNEIHEDFRNIEKSLNKKGEFDFVYDQVVSWGEILSSKILATFLQEEEIPVQWIDSRKYIRTDSAWREGKVDWNETEKKCQTLLPLLLEKIIVTQGFLGSNENGNTLTLGRDGSDFSAAIFASCLDASSVTIWKDVPGVMNADPKRLPAAVVFEELPFREAAEMTYYGASVIHPKTIRPLATKNIPLYVKNFDDPVLAGTKIHECTVFQLPPLIVFKENQCLISCKVTDYTFFQEEQIGIIFDALLKQNVKINVMQNSAISFSFCIDFRESKVAKLIEELSKNFEVYYNTNLTLITVKNYDAKTFEEYRSKPGVILEQSSRSTLQVLVKS